MLTEPLRIGCGEGNGNPLQYSWLENPVDRKAWGAAVHGVTQSRTQLKQVSSSSKGSLSFFFMAELYSIVCIYHLIFIPSSVDEY